MKKLIVLMVITACLSSCYTDDISGSGVIVTESRELNAFTAVSVDGIFNVTVAQGDAQSVKITADDNVIGFVKTEVVDGSLKVYLAPGQNYKNIGLAAEIMVKGFNGLSNKGSGTIKISNVDNPSFFLKNFGSGDIALSGASGELLIENEGSGRISGFSFLSGSSNINIIGSGDVEVSCENELTVNIDGSAKVFYKGQPTITSNIEGSGKVINSN